MHPQWPAVHLLHCLLAITGSLVAIAQPAAGFVLVLLTAFSLFGDLTGRVYLLRLLFFRRASQNVVSPPLRPEPAPRLILCAGYDAAPTGAVYGRRWVAGYERLGHLLHLRTSPAAVVFWSVALLLPPLGLRLAGIDAEWVSILQLPQTLLLLIAAFALGEIALSPPTPGANGNASGVAAALLAASALQKEPPTTLKVHVLACGAAESTREGMRAFVRSHRKQLGRKETWFVDLDSAGSGDPRYVEREVPVLAQRLDRRLLGLCEALADGSPERMGLPLGPAGCASLAAEWGYPAAALTAREGLAVLPPNHHTPADRPEGISGDSIEAVAELAVDLVRLLDRELTREAASGSTEEPET